MSECKTVLRFFTIADYEEEEQWLHQQHSRGWKLVKMIPPCFYRFEKCQPEDVVYRLDYQNGQENGNYFQMFHDYGWEYLGQCGLAVFPQVCGTRKLSGGQHPVFGQRLQTGFNHPGV